MEYKLSELVKLRYGKSQKRVENTNGKYPIIGTGGIIGYASDYLYNSPSVLIGRKGSIQNIYYIDKPFWTIDTLFFTEINENFIIPKFLYYKLKTIDFIQYNEGTSIPSLRTQTLNEIILDIPKFSEQKKITNTLNNLDKKIEVNNKIISNLEEQAQSIFKSWFIDFEPFQDGNFVESELGLIPEGWEVKNIGCLIDFDIGGGWGKETPNDKYCLPAYVIRGTDIENIKKGFYNKENYRFHTVSNLKNRRLQYGDIIFESSGGSVNQDLGRMLYVSDKLLEEYNDDVICASFCKLIRADNVITRWFLYNSLKFAYNRRYLTKYEVKSTGISNFSFKIFKDDYKIVYPNNKFLKKYFELTYDNFKLISNLSIQNKKIAEIRDALLPKLMSGEIDVSSINLEEGEILNE